jgi:hypothetical protein
MNDDTEALLRLIDAVKKAGEEITDSINQGFETIESAILLSDGIEERLRRIADSLDAHTEETRMINIKRRNNE